MKKSVQSAIIATPLLGGALSLYWGYSLALLRLVPCDDVFRLHGAKPGCAEPLVLVHAGWSLLAVGTVLGVVRWLRNL